MALPTWITEASQCCHDERCIYKCAEHLKRALEIAWNALERIDKKSLVYHAKGAMKEIEEISLPE